MARRLSPQHDEHTREKIKTSQLVNRLVKHALGDVDMTPTQVKAAEVLLRKVLPDLSAVDANMNATHTFAISGQEMDVDAWSDAHGSADPHHLGAATGASESTH